jgi:CheY-like chemotaxis protein
MGDTDRAVDGPILAISADVFDESYLPMTDSPMLALADDDELHAELVCTWLEHHGFRVVHFPSGDELISWASAGERHVDAFVLDIDMPGRDGIQSSRELRALDSYARVPTVFVSSTSPRAVVEAAPDTGRVEFIRKDGEMFVRLAAWLNDNLYASP